jgi:hypothetical protein
LSETPVEIVGKVVAEVKAKVAAKAVANMYLQAVVVIVQELVDLVLVIRAKAKVEEMLVGEPVGTPSYLLFHLKPLHRFLVGLYLRRRK